MTASAISPAPKNCETAQAIVMTAITVNDSGERSVLTCSHVSAGMYAAE